MKQILRLLFLALTIAPVFIMGQNPGLVAKFGIDGDLSNDILQQGTGAQPGSHDWFKLQNGGTGIGLIDTTGTGIYKPMIAAGKNVTFTRGQSISRYSIVNNMYMLDSRYARDGFGYNSNIIDSTVFKYSNKNGSNPDNWGFENPGGSVQNKNDIIDIYAHMRRNGTTINPTNPSPLYLKAGATTLGTEGDRYIDFELYRSRIDFNHSTGFSNTGSSATGGHTIWTFNPDGTVKSTGDMLVSFSYSSTAVSDIAVYIWVSKTAKDNVNPFYFDFIPAEFFGEGFNPDYGYCRITQNGGLPNYEFFATTNISNSTGPFWGSNSKNLGVTGTNYASLDYSPGQLSEIAINLTALGIDPALGNTNSTTDPCAPPFTRIMVKSRSSSSITSELKDFTGPFPFLDAPQVPQQIAPAHLTCSNNTTTLAPLNPQAGAFYVWSTVGGTILTNPISQSITVQGEGKYFLTASIVSGCLGLIDSIELTKDTHQPVATASTLGIVNRNNPAIMATLVGGDSAASDYLTPFGNSAGLSWEWSGPAGFNATTKNTQTNQEGTFMLIVTELRNGCKDTATTLVVSSQTLPVQLNNFMGSKNKNNVQLQWNVSTNEIANTFEVERSLDGKNFNNAAVMFGTEKSGNEHYSYTEVNEDAKVYYRLRMTDKSDVVTYSKILVFTSASNSKPLNVIGNVVNDKLTFSYESKTITNAEIRIVDMSGKLVARQAIKTNKGNNLASISLPSSMDNGMYIAVLTIENVNSTAKFIKQ